MNCDDIARLAPLYVTGELDSPRAAEFDAHLKTCWSCMEELERQSRLDARLREVLLAEETNVTGVDRRVRELIASEGERKAMPGLHPGRRGWALGLAAAAVLILAVVGYRVFLGNFTARVFADAARDHTIEVVEREARSWLSDPGAIASLAAQQGIAPAAIDELSTGVYRLHRGRLCFLDGRVFLHLVFSDGVREFSVYLRARGSKSLPGPVREMANGDPVCTFEADHEHLASITTSRHLAVVVSDESTDAALNFARFASTIL
jgi:anti-sigma factor RsiW